MLAETPVIQCSPCSSEVSASLENTLPDCSNYPHFPTLCKINVSMYIPKQGDISSPCVTVLDFRVMDLSLLSLSSLSYLLSLSLSLSHVKIFICHSRVRSEGWGGRALDSLTFVFCFACMCIPIIRISPSIGVNVTEIPSLFLRICHNTVTVHPQLSELRL